MAKYKRGESGNPAGRPNGSLNKNTQLVKLIETHAEALINKTVELALNGDVTALKLLLDKIIPRAKSESINIILPDNLKNDPLDMFNTILPALAGKEIALEHLKDLFGLVKNLSENPKMHQAKLDEEFRRTKEYMAQFEKNFHI